MELDGVIVATPPQHHLQASLGMIEAGFPVLIEKPLTMSLPEAELLVATARSAGAIVMVDHIQLFAPGVTALARRLSFEPSLTRIVLHSGAWGPFRRDVPVLWDWAPHDVAIALHLSNAVQARVLSCDVVRHPERPHGRAESVYLELALDADPISNASSVSASITVSNALTVKERWVEVQTPRTTFRYREYPLPQLREQPLQGRAIVHPISSQGPLDRVLLAFAEMARGREPNISGLELGRDVVRVLSEADRQG